MIHESLKIQVSVELVRVAIKRLGFSKKRARFFSEPPNLPEKIQEFLSKRNTYISQGYTFLSLDETSFGRNGFETRGFSPKGEKLFIKKKQPILITTSVIACCSSTGWKQFKEYKGSVNTIIFKSFLESIVFDPKSVMLMDNVRFHHSKEIREYLQSKNVEILFTPPYSPWFNPVEMCFSIVKKHFRENQCIQAAFQHLKQFHFQSFFQKSCTAISKF